MFWHEPLLFKDGGGNRSFVKGLALGSRQGPALSGINLLREPYRFIGRHPFPPSSRGRPPSHPFMLGTVVMSLATVAAH